MNPRQAYEIFDRDGNGDVTMDEMEMAYVPSKSLISVTVLLTASPIAASTSTASDSPWQA
jgi:hypothetical protein